MRVLLVQYGKCHCVLLFLTVIARDALLVDTSLLGKTVSKYSIQKLANFTLRLHNTLEDARIRRTHSALEKVEGNYDINNVTKQSLESSDSISAWCPVEVDGIYYIFAGTTEGTISLYKDPELVPLYKFSSEESLYHLLEFRFKEGLFLVGVHRGNEGTYYIQIYEYISISVTMKNLQQIQLPGDSLVDIVESKDKIYLIFSTSMPTSEIRLFLWIGTQFNRIATLPLRGKCGSLSTWELETSIFIAVSFNDKSLIEILRFSISNSEVISSVQILEGKFGIVKHFQVDQDHYLICAKKNIAVIYWWNGIDFIEQQSIVTTTTDDIVDLSVLVLRSYIANIIIAKANLLEYFVQQKSVMFSKVSKIKTEKSKRIKNIIFWKKQQDFLVLPVFQENSPPLVYEFEFVSRDLTLDIEFSGLQKCALDMETSFNQKNEDIDYIYNNLTNVWMKGNASSPPFVSIKGSIFSNATAIIKKASFRNASTVSNLVPVQGLYEKLHNKVKKLKSILKKVVLRNNSCTVRGNIHFKDIIEIKKGEIGHLKSVESLNSINSSSLHSILKTEGNQVLYTAILKNGNFTVVNTSHLNKELITDYMLLKQGYQNVTGSFNFSYLSVKSMNSNILNNILWKDFFLFSSVDSVINVKRFKNISCNIISTKSLVNKINISDYSQHIVRKDKDFFVDMNINSSIEILGNLTLNYINGNNISNLISLSVKRNGSETIDGLKVFLKTVSIKEKLYILEYINNFNLSTVLTLNTPQVIPGTLICSSVKFKSVDTNTINNIALSETAVLKSSNYTKLQKMHFMESVYVSDIKMEDKSIINSLSISMELTHILMKNVSYFTNEFVFENVSVVENGEIDDLNVKNILFNLKNNLWLKNKHQNISNGNFKSISTQDLLIKTVNNVSLTDVIAVNSSDFIHSSKVFNHDVQVKALKILLGKTVNGLDVYSEFMSSMTNMDAVKFTVRDMLVNGNVSAIGLNNASMSDLMQVEKFQICHGNYVFHKILLYNLTTVNLAFSKFHDHDFRDYKSSAVLMPEHFILNKTFSSIEGRDLTISGNLNWKEFKKMCKSILTLNSAQNIAGNVTFLNTLRIKTLNIMNLPILNSVILYDTSNKNISFKEFKGSFIAGDLKLSNKIDEMNFNDLNAFMFDKGKKNRIIKAASFATNVTMFKFNILNAGTINSINLTELIKITNSSYVKAMNFSTIRGVNVNISGEINYCGIVQDLFYNRSPFENKMEIISMKTFNSIEINGDLCIKSTFNNISYLEINQTLSDLNSSNIYQGTFIFLNVSLNNFHTLNLINNIDVGFLLKDAAKNKTWEALNGLKKFKNIHSHKISIYNLKVSTLFDVNITLFYNTYISKSRRQPLFLSSFPAIFARNIVIKRTINEVDLHHDLILSDVDELITSPVHVYETMNILSDIVISRNINDRDISYFVKNRISLSDSSDISSSLIFSENLTALGDLKIVNFVNGLSLNETVKMTGDTTILGNVAFLESPLILSDMIIYGFFNGISIEDLSTNIYYVDASENVTELVEFSNLNLSTLISIDVLGISINNLSDVIHALEDNVFIVLDVLSKLINYDNKAIIDIEDSLSYPLSLFAYFELHQLLNIGSSLKILPVHEYGSASDNSDPTSLQLIIWVSQNDTCRYFKSIIMDIHPNGTLLKNAILNGRLFSFNLQTFEENVKGFMLHADRRRRCNKNKPVIVRTLYFNGDTRAKVIISPSNSEVVDVRLIEMDTGIHLLIVYDFNGAGETLYMYKYSFLDDSWLILQKFHLFKVSSIDTISIKDFELTEIYLAVTGFGIQSGIYLYIWDFEENLFDFKIFISQSSSNASLWISTKQDIYLLLAKEKTKIHKDIGWIDMYTDPLEVYILDTNFDDLILDHTINVYGISSLELFKLEDETYVLAVSRHFQTVYVIQNRGFNGFEVIQEINSPGVVDATLFITPNKDILIAISSTTGHTRVLKPVIRGSSYIEY